jgi:hypothetical protein
VRHALVLRPSADVPVALAVVSVREDEGRELGEGRDEVACRPCLPVDLTPEQLGLCPEIAVVVGEQDHRDEEPERGVTQAGGDRVLEQLGLDGPNAAAHRAPRRPLRVIFRDA